MVAERRASRRTAEVAQQVVRTCPAGVDVEDIGRLKMLSGDSDLNSRVNSMPWSQWSITVRSYFGEFNQTATRLRQRVEKKRGRSDHRRQHDDVRSGETTFNTGVLCACTDLQEESAASGPGSRHGDGCVESLDSILRRDPVECSKLSCRRRSQSSRSGWSVSGETEERSARNSRAMRSLTGSQQDRRRGIVIVRKRPSSSEQDRRVRCPEARTPRTWCRWAVEKVTSQRNRRSTSARRNLVTEATCTTRQSHCRGS